MYKRYFYQKVWCVVLAGSLLGLASCGHTRREQNKRANGGVDSLVHEIEYGLQIVPQSPLATPSQNKFAKVLGWKSTQSPTAAKGFKVVRFADSLNSPRNIYVAPNGDVFVAQSRTEKKGEKEEKVDARNTFRSESINNILRFSDENGDGIAEKKEVVIEDLEQPYGMLIHKDWFYVANTNALLRYRYRDGKPSGEAEKLIDLPAGGYNNHWTRNIMLNADSTKIFVSVGSGSNVGENGMEHERRRANILEVSLDGTEERVFASGIRNPVGMAIEPNTLSLWTAVNERDELGDELVPDYITSVKENGFYGWPYAYWGHFPDPRWKNRLPQTLVEQSITPDYAVGAHTASLGLAFNGAPGFPEGAYVGQHGSWNRSTFSGYKVVFVPFEKGRPVGEPQDFLTGFIADERVSTVYGRPVAVAFTKTYMLVTDDAANVIWTVKVEDYKER
ncbi:PQQ-dependent sugar dehydrogenase [Sphingobacterium suaedae]|uniref:PQQ-dependent sugar dehydrogenase n=2 Tax=Sphingobacterium suaedae TaxID=1686402 RepID=A0ABW5KIN3_9SPHI